MHWVTGSARAGIWWLIDQHCVNALHIGASKALNMSGSKIKPNNNNNKKKSKLDNESVFLKCGKFEQ
jgi:hypothetical protein